jgi:predicted dehydrogenase/nucleoside-diphosphate-sugar epimerase
MKVLITGASGFLGGYLSELFVQAGHQVRGMVRRTSRTDLLDRLGVEAVLGDLKDAASLRRAVEGVEVVVHAAATMGGIPQEYAAATVEGTRDLLEAAHRAGVRRFVHVSSISVYPLKPPAGGAAITEESPYETEPLFFTNYTRSKVEADRAALEFAQKGAMEVIVLRPGILYGPRGRWELPRMGYAAGPNRYIVIGGGRKPLPVCHVRSCARAALLAAEGPLKSGVFNILDDEPFSAMEYLKRLKADVRPRLKVTRVPYVLARAAGWLLGLGTGLIGRPSPLHPAHLVQCARRPTYSNARARDVLGWRPEADKETALAETMGSFAARERVSRRADLAVLGRPVADVPPLSACLIGCGGIAETHLQILGRMKNARVAGLCDTNQEAARVLAERFGVPQVFTDALEMVEALRPDMVHILTPPQSHAAYAELAARAGCNVLVEKPMAMDAAEGERMAACARECGVQLCVDHNHLYDPVMVRARRMMESGMLGDIVWVESYYGFNLGDNPASRYMAPGGERHWSFQLPGGFYQNLAPHPICLALEALGEPTRISAHARYGRVLPHAPTDELRILLETGAASGLVTVSLAASPRFQYLNVLGTKGALFVDLLDKWAIPQQTRRGIPRGISRALMNLGAASTIFFGTLGGMASVLRRRWTPFDGMELLVREFYAALQRGGPPPVGAEEALAVMRVMDEAWRQIGPRSVRPQDGGS